MKNCFIEHVNITVTNPKETAAMLSSIFGWEIRWEGPSKDNGYTVHVGTETDYLALYSNGSNTEAGKQTYVTKGGLNHVGVVVDDLEAVEKKVAEAGFEPNNHGDYEPGSRFYFDDGDGIEFEVVSYR